MRSKTIWIWLPLLLIGLVSACYYSPQTKRGKADPNFISEADAEKIVQMKFSPYGIKFVNNMKLQREGGVAFETDGYDRDLRVGFEYMSHEGGDFEGEDDSQNADGLTKPEIDTLRDRQQTYREFFLLIPEGTREQVEQATEGFIKNLFAWEVLKKKGEAKKENLFPEDGKKKEDLIPWESTADLKKKRKEMETKEKKDGSSDSEEWGKDEDKEGNEESAPAPEPTKTKDKEKDKDKKKAKPASKDKDDWGDEDGGDVDF